MEKLPFEERIIQYLSRIEFAINSVASAIREPYQFPKQELISPSDELSKQFDEIRKEERQAKPLHTQNQILLVTLIITVITSATTTFLQYRQTSIANSDTMPQLRLMSSQIQNENKIFSENQIRIYNFGKPLSNLDVKTFVFVSPDHIEYATKNKELVLNGYYFTSVIHRDQNGLEMILGGIKDNNLLFQNLSNDLYKQKGTFLNLEVYFEVNYRDINNTQHLDYYKLNEFEGLKISNQEGREIEKKYNSIPMIDLGNITEKDLETQFGIK